jgi:hypothetical protein
VLGLVADAPLTVQLIGASPPEIVQATLVEDAVVLLPVVGAVIVTARPDPRLTFTTFESEPNVLLHATVMAFAPMFRLTVAGLVAALPLTVQLTGAVPVDVQATEVVVFVVVLPLAGAVIVTTGATPRVTDTDWVSEPNALVQETVIVLAPTFSATEAGLVAAAPLTVQEVGGVPLETHVTEVDAADVFVPLVGDVIVTPGAVPRLTVTTLVFDPYALEQVTVIVFAPVTSVTLAGLVAALPLTVHETGAVPVELNDTGIDEAVVLVLFAGLEIVTTGGVLTLQFVVV